ncbi:hypothetical protein [Methanopyrus sp. KOL6]|uniref:hypothetical protein n=1 Tax=Methanopyrus sp. KOL6 TaxID=1937004 RepID=UPI000B4B1CD3|nr:hypothetical protein [Methanopyrus sp. KOL6]
MRGQITVDALAAGLISAVILLLVTDVARVVTAHGITSLKAYELYVSVDRFVASLTSPSWVGANLTWYDIVWLWSEPLRWTWGGAPLRTGVRMYLAVDAFKWTRYSEDGSLDSPIRVKNGRMVADLVFPKDDLNIPGESVVKSYDIILVERGNYPVYDENLPQVYGNTVSYSGNVPGVKVVWVTVSGDGLYGWVRWLHKRYNQLIRSGLSEGEAYKELASEAVRVDSGGNRIVFYSSSGWATDDPVELVRRIVAEGEGTGLSLTIIAIGGKPFTVTLNGSENEIFWNQWTAGLFPVKLRAGVTTG